MSDGLKADMHLDYFNGESFIILNVWLGFVGRNFDRCDSNLN